MAWSSASAIARTLSSGPNVNNPTDWSTTPMPAGTPPPPMVPAARPYPTAWAVILVPTRPGVSESSRGKITLTAANPTRSVLRRVTGRGHGCLCPVLTPGTDQESDRQERAAHRREPRPPRTGAGQRHHYNRRTQGRAHRPRRMQPTHISDPAVQRDVRVHAGVNEARAGARQEADHDDDPPLRRQGQAKPGHGAESAAAHEEARGAEPAGERSTGGARQKIRNRKGRQHEPETRQRRPERGAHVRPGDAEGSRRDPRRHKGQKRDAASDPLTGAWPWLDVAHAHVEDYHSSSSWTPMGG